MTDSTEIDRIEDAMVANGVLLTCPHHHQFDT